MADIEQTVSLLDQIKRVAEARQRLEEATNIRIEAYNKWKEDNKLIFDTGETALKTCVEAETLLRELTIKAYNETGSKAPAPGVGIRVTTKLEYDLDVALTWAHAHNMALALDKKAFEKIALASPIDFVTQSEEPIATIATELVRVE